MARYADPAKKAAAAELEAQGAPRAEIAAELEVHPRTVSNWLGPLPAGRPEVSDARASGRTARRRAEGASTLETLERRRRAREMRAAGKAGTEIAAALGVSPETVSRWAGADRKSGESPGNA